MKSLLLISTLLISFSFYAQSKDHVGVYKLDLGEESHFEKTTLTLNADGTFLFHFYDYREKGMPKERNKYGKGTWISKGKLILFSSSEKDVDDTHVLNFNNSKARFDTKSPRDKSDSVKKTSIRFYESDIFWIVGRTMIKN